jgi:hypothetical protein
VPWENWMGFPLEGLSDHFSEQLEHPCEFRRVPCENWMGLPLDPFDWLLDHSSEELDQHWE